MRDSTATHITVNALPSEPAPRHCRDRDLLIFVACQGVVAIDHVMSALLIGRTAAYRRVAHCVEAGLIERLELLRTEPSLLRVTRKGLRYLGLDALPVAEVTPATAPHWLRCASVARHLIETEVDPHQLLSERDIRLAEQLHSGPIASAKVGELPGGGPRYHRPDLAILTPNFVALPEGRSPVRFRERGAGPETPEPAGNRAQGPGEGGEGSRTLAAHPRTRPRGGSDSSEISSHQQREGSEAEALMQGGEISGDHGRPPAGAEEMGVVAIEVELSLKAPRRLQAILRGWRRAHWVQEVRYYAAPGPVTRGLERAVAKTHTAEKVRILELVPR